MQRTLGFWPRQTDVGEAMKWIQMAVLLDKRQLQHLFPDARIVAERFFGLTKSLYAIRKITDATDGRCCRRYSAIATSTRRN